MPRESRSVVSAFCARALAAQRRPCAASSRPARVSAASSAVLACCSARFAAPSARTSDNRARSSWNPDANTRAAASADASYLYPAIETQAARYAKELKTPGAILFGAEDAILAPQLQGKTMETYGLNCMIAPDHGHMLPITAPDLCESFIRSTVETLPDD